MEKNQYELCLEVLKRLNKAGVLSEVVLIGSWCVPFYKNYFSSVLYTTSIKTRDVDFLVPSPNKLTIHADIPALSKDLGLVVYFQGAQEIIQLEHPELVIEFLVPEKGRGASRPVRLPRLGVNAVALRFLDFLAGHTIQVEVRDFKVSVPHPAQFALHKLIVSQRRTKADKAAKDLNAAREILKALMAKGESGVILKVFDSVPQAWQKKIIKGLDAIEDRDVLRILQRE